MAPEYFSNIDQVLAPVRHEMGNSINSVKIALEVLVRNFDVFDDEHKLKMLQGALEQTERQTKVMRALKSYSRTTINDITDMPFSPLWNEFMMTVNRKTKESGIEITVENPTEAKWIRADKNALRSIFGHLLTNALDSVENVEDPRITIGTMNSEGRLHVFFWDNGPEISEKNLARLCVPMFTTKKNNAGIGLSIVQKILAKMDGILHIITSADGNRFEIGLPLAETKSAIKKYSDSFVAV